MELDELCPECVLGHGQQTSLAFSVKYAHHHDTDQQKQKK
jgi:hypothetical protein